MCVCVSVCVGIYMCLGEVRFVFAPVLGEILLRGEIHPPGSHRAKRCDSCS